MADAAVSFLSRLEPRPRDNDLRRSLAAEVRDPLWFLFRQWQMGEFQGEDTGSLAYIKYTGSTATIPRWAKTGDATELALDAHAPLEPQTLREPFEPDFSLKVELGQDFADLLRVRVGNDATTDTILGVFLADEKYKIKQLTDDKELDPVDPASKRFLRVCAGRTLNGAALYKLGAGGALPSGLPGGTETPIRDALTDLVGRANEVFGQIRDEETQQIADPLNWQKERLEYQLQVVGVNPDPAGQGNVRLDAHPDSSGEYDWFSFDAQTKNAAATEPVPPRQVSFSMVPARVQFDGMPSPRFWNFEDNHLALPDISAEADDLVKIMAADFMLVHSNDWYVIPYAQPVGTLARTKYILVRDVFGKLTVVHRADADQMAPGTDRWTMFSTTDFSGGPGTETLADYFILPPSSGPAMQLGAVLEDVRFGRDETANMAFGIERITASPIGEPRSGRERDAEIDARRKPTTPPPTTDFPLKYSVESEIPANWIPLFPVPEDLPNAATNPSIVLQRGSAVKATTTGSDTVPSLSKILNPGDLHSDYFIKEEEIPRSGLRVERVVFRTRWIDGTSHLWVQRRRRIGAGESQSGLQFDQPLPNTR